MFFIMRKDRALFNAKIKRFSRSKSPVQVTRFKEIEKARKYIEDTSLYIEYGKLEVREVNKQLAAEKRS